MPTYVMLTSLTDSGCETLTKNPERIKEVNKDVEDMGGRVIAQYALLGCYDFLNIVEAADNETIGKISVKLASRGTVRIQTYPAIDVDAFVKSLQ